MKKSIKKVLLVLGVIIGIILLDSIQALVFDNNPIIGIQTRNMKKVGILVDTYHCGNGKHDTVIKGFSYSCSYDDGNYTLVDETKEKKDFACAEALEGFYEDENYIYYWSCIKNKYMIVKYDGGSKETISEALKQGHIDIQTLDKFNISYIKEEKDLTTSNNEKIEKEIEENLIKISKVTNLTSSNPFDYTKNEYYENIVNLGVEAVPVLENMYNNGKLNGVNAYLSALAIQDITNCNLYEKYNLEWSTAEEFYSLWKNNNCEFNK